MLKLLVLIHCSIMFLFANNILNLNETNTQILKLKDNNFLIFSVVDNNDMIKYIEFDNWPLDLLKYEDGIKTFKSTYEIVPIKSTIKIHNNDGYKKFDVDIVYDMNDNIETLVDNWNLNKFRYFNGGYLILESIPQNTLEYQKNFDEGFSLSFDMIKDYKNNDFKIIFGDRTSFYFDNKNIYVVLKEKINKKITYQKYKLSKEDFKFKNGKKYNISLTVKQNDDVFNFKYKLNISNLDDSINYSFEFEDYGYNNIEYERYKSLKVQVNNMYVKLKNIIIKGN